MCVSDLTLEAILLCGALPALIAGYHSDGYRSNGYLQVESPTMI